MGLTLVYLSWGGGVLKNAVHPLRIISETALITVSI